MKRIVSIVLLIVFLFNVGGYYFVFWGLIRTSDRALARRIDEGSYLPDETVELKIQVTLPYPIQQQDFKRVDGKFEHKGEFYKLVKHRLANDTIYIICLRDHQEKRIVKTLNDYLKLTSELPPASKKTPRFPGKFLQDFESASNGGILHHIGWSREVSGTRKLFELLSPETRVSSPPPKG